MFTLDWQGKVTAVKAAGKEGEDHLRVTLVATAEDAMMQVDAVGVACRQAYKLVKGGKTGTIPVKMPARWLCQMLLSYDLGGKSKSLKIPRAIPETLSIVATKDGKPPSIKMVVTVEYTDKEALHLLRSNKRDVTVNIGSADGKGIPFDTSTGDPKKRGNGKVTVPADAVPPPA
jgi:hypothetical protein